MALYDSLDGAKRSVDERESFLFESLGATPEITAVTISPVSMTPIGEQSAGFRLDITTEEGVAVDNQLAFRRNKVVGVVTIAPLCLINEEPPPSGGGGV